MRGSKKDEVIKILQMFARVGRLRRENIFKVRAFDNAAQSIASFSGNFVALYRSGGIKKIPGVGPRILAIIEAVMNGKTLEEFFPNVPIDLIEIAELPFIGIKRAERLKEIGITTIEQVKAAAVDGKLTSVQGIGRLIENKIKAGLSKTEKQYRKFGQVRLEQALLAANKIIKKLKNNKNISEVLLVGDLRRGFDVVNTIDVLITGKVLLGELEELLKNIDIVQVTNLNKPIRGRGGKLRQGIVVNVFRSPKWQKGIAQILLTGSPEFIQKILKFSKMSFHEIINLRAENEELAFNKLGLAYVPPERREKHLSLKSLKRSYPRLVELKDLQGAFHNHTSASDGKNTLLEMQMAAFDKGLRYLSINDHSPSAFYAGGQSKEALLAQIRAINRLNQTDLGKSCPLLTGVESDIKLDGSLDYADNVLRKLEIIVASIHNQLGMHSEEMTPRIVKAALNPLTTIIGHPTGRIIFKRPASTFDMEKLIEACKQNHVALELNCQPARLDLNERNLAMAKEQGVLIAINADAHSTRGLDFLEYGVMVARRAGLTAEDVLNALPLEELRLWLKSRHYS